MKEQPGHGCAGAGMEPLGEQQHTCNVNISKSIISDMNVKKSSYLNVCLDKNVGRTR